jgi:hypothetical protein
MMAKFISKGGKCYPAKEKVSLTYNGDKTVYKKDLPEYFVFDGDKLEPGDPFIYQGPCRDALKMLEEAGEDHLGMDFRDCSEFQDFINQKHQGNTAQYLKRKGYNKEKEDADFEKRAVIVNKHELPQRVKEIKAMGGGQDRTGNKENDVIGGFGSQRHRTPAELK